MPEPRSLWVTLRGDAAAALHDLAIQEYRRPKEQAAYLLEAALRQRGVLPELPAIRSCEDGSPQPAA